MVQVPVQVQVQDQDQVQVQARAQVLVHLRLVEVVVVQRQAHLPGHTLDQEPVLDLETEVDQVVVVTEVDTAEGMVEEMVVTKFMHVNFHS